MKTKPEPKKLVEIFAEQDLKDRVVLSLEKLDRIIELLEKISDDTYRTLLQTRRKEHEDFWCK